MPTDSTELTFVRCPSCRSLVPAMSTRCRMCGATLEAVGKEEAKSNDPQKQQGRVRQRTMSQPDQDLESGLDDVRESKPVPESKPQLEAKSKEIAIDDPLRDFLEEIPLEDEASIKPEPGKQNGPSIEDSRVIIETGKGGRSEGLSFGKPKSESAPELKKEEPKESRPEPKPQPSQAAPRPPQPPPPPRPQHQPNRPPQPPREETREEKRVAPPPTPPQQQHQHKEQREFRPQKREEPREQIREQREQPQQREQRHQPNRPAEKSPHKLQAQHGGRLFGWLVSYDDPNGNAIEIREGKFFVSRERLKPNDLVVDHDSISTPHAVLVTEVGTGLYVQDLMSDHGVFVKRRGANDYEKQDDRIAVSHGDWLRFGEVEFLVSLVAHVGVK